MSLGGGRRGRVETLTRSRNRARRLGALLAVAILCGASDLGTRPALAVMVGGGGSARMDCLAVFDAPANTPAKRPKNIRCTDGDAACDADGTVNGACEFPIAVCANSAFNPACSMSSVQAITVDHALDDGDPRFDPALQALQARIHNEIDPPTTASDQCTAPSVFRVAIRGPFAAGVCKPSKRVVKMTTLSGLIQGKLYRDVDRMKLRCDPAPEGCSPQALFTGTFDRIQRQIFNQSCALSGCHDSQSRTGELLLESGAAYTNLVDVAPENAAAAAAGWKRVRLLDATAGDPATSLLVQKLIGPPPGFGARMPFNAPRLDQTLIDVVQLWVAAGAPETGWVPGTD